MNIFNLIAVKRFVPQMVCWLGNVTLVEVPTTMPPFYYLQGCLHIQMLLGVYLLSSQIRQTFPIPILGSLPSSGIEKEENGPTVYSLSSK